MNRHVLLLLFMLMAAFVSAQESSGIITDARVYEIANKLRCPICVSESVAASSAEISVTMRGEIREYLQAGLTEQQILDEFTASYGDWVLLEPPRRGLHLLVWLLPAVVAVAGAIMLYGFMRRSTRAGAEHVEASEEELARLREEMGRKPDGDS